MSIRRKLSEALVYLKVQKFGVTGNASVKFQAITPLKLCLIASMNNLRFVRRVIASVRAT